MTITNLCWIMYRAINGILAMHEFKEQFATKCKDADGQPDICPEDKALIVAILSAGTVIGAILSAPAADSIGRRQTLLVSVGIFCIGAICQTCAQAQDLMLAGRYVVCHLVSTFHATVRRPDSGLGCSLE
jgi:MFS transporter, SP family, sugar:H+ symporter